MYNTGSAAAELSGGQLTMGIIGCLPDNVQQVTCVSSLSVALSRTRVVSFCIHMCFNIINPLKPELNPICYLLALLGAHHFLHVCRIRVNY